MASPARGVQAASPGAPCPGEGAGAWPTLAVESGEEKHRVSRKISGEEGLELGHGAPYMGLEPPCLSSLTSSPKVLDKGHHLTRASYVPYSNRLMHTKTLWGSWGSHITEEETKAQRS